MRNPCASDPLCRIGAIVWPKNETTSPRTANDPPCASVVFVTGATTPQTVLLNQSSIVHASVHTSNPPFKTCACNEPLKGPRQTASKLNKRQRFIKNRSNMNPI